MDSSLIPAAPTADLIPAPSRRHAMDWSLVLASQGLDGTLLEAEGGGFGLLVPGSQAEAARAAIDAYRQENRRWRWQRRIPTTPLLFHWGSTGWVLALVAFAALSAKIPGIRDAGVMQASGISGGEFWRLLTATFLHADTAHLVSNLLAGYLFVGVAMGIWGAGVALFSVLIAGVMGNIAGWLVYPPNYTAVGASGMVMGAIGLLAAAPAPRGPLGRLSFSIVLRTLTPALLLFVLYGFSPKPGTDWIGHTAGFLTGLAFGWIWRPLRKAAGTPRRLNHWLLGVSIALTMLAWGTAWRH